MSSAVGRIGSSLWMICVAIACCTMQSGCDEPSAQNAFSAGEGSVKFGEYDDAIEFFTSAIERDPNYLAAYLKRAECYLKLNDQERALADLSRAIELQPNADIGTYRQRASCYIGLQKYEEAISDLSVVIRIAPTAADYYWRARSYRAIGDDQSCYFALPDCDAVLKLEPDNVNIRVVRGWALMADTGPDYRGAIDEFTLAIDGGCVEKTQAYHGRAVANFMIKHYPRVISDCEQLISLDPTNAAGFRLLAISQERLQDYNSALQNFTERIRLEPNSAEAYLHRAGVFKKLGKHQNAELDLKRAKALSDQP